MDLWLKSLKTDPLARMKKLQDNAFKTVLLNISKSFYILSLADLASFWG